MASKLPGSHKTHTLFTAPCLLRADSSLSLRPGTLTFEAPDIFSDSFSGSFSSTNPLVSGLFLPSPRSRTLGWFGECGSCQLAHSDVWLAGHGRHKALKAAAPPLPSVGAVPGLAQRVGSEQVSAAGTRRAGSQDQPSRGLPTPSSLQEPQPPGPAVARTSGPHGPPAGGR